MTGDNLNKEDIKFLNRLMIGIAMITIGTLIALTLITYKVGSVADRETKTEHHVSGTTN